MSDRACDGQGWGGPCHHWRRQWFDIAKSPPAPIAAEVLQRIAELYQIEAEIRGEEADARRAVRQQKSKSLIEP